jgi:hypothetical protein
LNCSRYCFWSKKSSMKVATLKELVCVFQALMLPEIISDCREYPASRESS